MLYEILTTACLAVFTLNVILNLRSLRAPRPDGALPDAAPLVSVLVPARNEEGNIGPCLESLQNQDYPNLEILVLDDNSSDNTAGIAREMACRDDRIRVLRGEPLDILEVHAD